MKEYIKSFMGEFEFPDEAQKELLEVYDKLSENGILEILKVYIDEYEEKNTTQWDPAALKIMEVSKEKGVSEYSVNLIFLICLTKHAKKLYAQNGYSYEQYKANFNDLYYKLFECYNYHGIWGNGEIRYWYGRFFEMNILHLGRFQFEKREFHNPLGEDYKNGSKCIKNGDLVINIHIPSDGRPITKELIDDAFAKGYEQYKDFFEDGVVPFNLRSWLLYERQKEFLPETSNILTLMNYFDIYYSHDDEKFLDWWRIFYKNYDNNIDEMPTDTSLQRAYVDWVKKGNFPGHGHGIFLYKPNM